jgi:hypothetical protein
VHFVHTLLTRYQALPGHAAVASTTRD